MNVHSITTFQPLIKTDLGKIRVRGISNIDEVGTMFVFGNAGIFKYHNKSLFNDCEIDGNNALIIKYEEDLLW